MIIFSLHSQSSSSPPFNRPENHFNHLRSLPLKMPLTVSYLLLVFRWNLSILLFNTVVIDAPSPSTFWKTSTLPSIYHLPELLTCDYKKLSALCDSFLASNLFSAQLKYFVRAQFVYT